MSKQSMDQQPSEASAKNNASSSVIDLVFNLVQESADLLQAEITLVKEEVEEKIQQSTYAMWTVTSGMIITTAGLIVLLFSLVFALNLILPLWGAALLIGTLATSLGGIFMYVGKVNLQQKNADWQESIVTKMNLAKSTQEE